MSRYSRAASLVFGNGPGFNECMGLTPPMVISRPILHRRIDELC